MLARGLLYKSIYEVGKRALTRFTTLRGRFRFMFAVYDHIVAHVASSLLPATLMVCYMPPRECYALYAYRTLLFCVDELYIKHYIVYCNFYDYNIHIRFRSFKGKKVGCLILTG